MKLSVEIDGEQVPLSACDWVLRMPCGCAESIVVTVMHSQTLATEDDAWTWFYRDEYGRKRDRDRKIAQDKTAGWTLALMRRKDAVAAITTSCSHEGGGSRG